MTTSNTVTISKQWINERMEGDTTRNSGYIALNASGKGKPYITISGNIEIVVWHCGSIKIDMAKLDNGTYCLRDAVDFARAGTHGLAIA